MSQQLSVRRRRRDDSDDLSEASSGSGKRYKGNDGNARAHRYTTGVSLDQSGYQPGSIVRVSMANFVTYERADFYPGPSLNMVIGPNGTGKSSLVCAICLGLGWTPTHLGRADDYKSFIKYGKKDATIEIELKAKSNEHNNHTIKVQIIKDAASKDGSKRRWWINGKDATLGKVRDLTRELSIQIDNLCQFLPQDKVSEFAALSAKDLLHSTQRAAAPPEMLTWHDQLISLRKKQKDLQLKHDTDTASLESYQKKRDGLQDDVNKLQDRANAEKKIELLRKARPFIEYKVRRDEFNAAKDKKKEANVQLRRLQARVNPTLEALNEKEEYQRQIEAVEKERIQSAKNAERALAATVKEREDIEHRIKQIEDARKSEQDSDANRKRAKVAIERKISDLRAQLQQVPEFDAADWNRRIKDEANTGRAAQNDIDDIKAESGRVREEGLPLRRAMEETTQQLDALDSQAGRQLNRLDKLSKDTAKGYAWIQEHQNEFEKPVYGPALVECRIKEGCEQYLDSVESVMNREVILSFTTQTRSDYLKLIRVFRETLNLSETYIRTSTQPISAYQPPLNEHQLSQFGLDGFVLDFVDGPDPVLAMLCSTVKLHMTGITLRSHSEAQYDRLVSENSPISSWIAGKTSFRVVRRREYGAFSTSAANVKPAKFWTEQSIDSSAKQELQTKLDECTLQWNNLKARNNQLKELLLTRQREKQESDKRGEELRKNKNELQKEASMHQSLPARIEKEEELLRQRIQDGKESREKFQNLTFDLHEAKLNKADIAFKYKDQFVTLHRAHEQLLEAEVWLLEAKSDIEALTERNREIMEQRKQAEALLEQATKDSDKAKARALKVQETVRAILVEVDDDEEDKEFLNNLPANWKEEELDIEIETERAILETNFASNPNAAKDYEKYQKEIARLESQIEESTSTLETYATQIADVREKWEPALDDLISNISDAFSYNFQQIGCAGEVGVHKDDDFDNWSLEIKVKFRDGPGESLQLLDSHRQSGGERSVSTIFFLMSLQSMARAPFRVVDEINQGMDPRNERMVHERMVDIACKEHTSQYFLITPKLLTGLRYDPRMRVLCIASGEYMPQNCETVSVAKAIAIKRALIAAA